MTRDGAPQRQTRNRLRQEPPLYDARYEHDACGVGFVADAGGRSSARVLALALGGLGALGHRGAFAADGASSDGAGVLLPLTPSLLRVLDPEAAAGERPGVLTVFAPPRRRSAPPETGARAIVEAALAAEGLPAPVWRRVPLDPGALGREAAAALPTIQQALVPRPPPSPSRRSSSRSPAPAGGRMPRPVASGSTASRSSPRRRGPSSTRASSPAGGSRSCSRT